MKYVSMFSAGTLFKFAVEVDESCDYFINIGYCQNNGECTIVSGQPECRLVK